MTTSNNPRKLPPIQCTPCRVTIGANRYRIYKDGSVSAALTREETQRMGFATFKEVLEYESKLTRMDPHSIEAKTIRREASRLRRNRNARERSQAMRDLGMKRSPATPGGWE